MIIWQVLSALVIMSFFGALAWIIGNTDTIWKRVAAVGIFLCSIPTILLAFYLTLGTPMPWIISGFPIGEGRVLGKYTSPKDGIYVLMAHDGPPVYYWMPWDRVLASKLESLEIGNTGAPVIWFRKGLGTKSITGNFEWSWDTRSGLDFNEKPQEKWLRDKPVGNNHDRVIVQTDDGSGAVILGPQ